MLSAGKLIGFVPTKDSRRSREFYEDKLGFRFVSDDQFALVMQAGESMIRIAKATVFTPAHYTVMGWEVPDVEAQVRWLNGRGVAFEKYPFVEDRELGIWTTPNGDKVAWFKDPDGNVLSLSHHNPEPPTSPPCQQAFRQQEFFPAQAGQRLAMLKVEFQW